MRARVWFTYSLCCVASFLRLYLFEMEEMDTKHDCVFAALNANNTDNADNADANNPGSSSNASYVGTICLFVVALLIAFSLPFILPFLRVDNCAKGTCVACAEFFRTCPACVPMILTCGLVCLGSEDIHVCIGCLGVTSTACFPGFHSL